MPGVTEELNQILDALDKGTVSIIQLSRYQAVVKKILERESKNTFALYLKAKLLILSTKPHDRIHIKAEVLDLVNEMATLAHSATYYHRKFALLIDLNVHDDEVYHEQKKACIELLKIPNTPSTYIYHKIAEKFLNEPLRKILRADFTASQITDQYLFPVQFFDRSTGTPSSWIWDFGEGNKSYEANPIHLYRHDGQFTVTLFVANKAGSHNIIKTVMINARENGEEVSDPAGNCREESTEKVKNEISYNGAKLPFKEEDQDKAVDHYRIMKHESTKNPMLTSPRKSLDNVHFSVAGPKTAKPMSEFLLTFWAFLDTQRNDVLRRIYDSHSYENTRIHYKGPVKIEREKEITLFIEIEDLIIKQNIASIYWTGEITTESFHVSVPNNVVVGTKIGKISLLVEGIEISTIHFSLEITNSLTQVRSLPVNVRIHQNAFASYSKKDTKKVLARIQAMEIVAPWIKVYIDFDGIRAGQYWKDELKKSISDIDVFYLFWSENAAKSYWVKREWQCALNSKGLDCIQPVPLVNPDKVPPPPELAPKQFMDKWLCYIEWANSTRSQHYLKKFIGIYKRNASLHF
jgi:PKD repeat protein